VHRFKGFQNDVDWIFGVPSRLPPLALRTLQEQLLSGCLRRLAATVVDSVVDARVLNLPMLHRFLNYVSEWIQSGVACEDGTPGITENRETCFP
jgi:hypothetical protein